MIKAILGFAIGSFVFFASLPSNAATSACPSPIPSWIPTCEGAGTSTTTCTTSTSSSTAALSVASGVPTMIQSQTLRDGESLAISTAPSHGTASRVNSGTDVSYTSNSGYVGGDTVGTQFVSLMYSCQVITIGDVVIGTNRVINTNTETRNISLTVGAAPNTAAVPTLSEWAQYTLALLVLGIAGWQLRQMRARR